jgi:hypothetical protein
MRRVAVLSWACLLVLVALPLLNGPRAAQWEYLSMAGVRSTCIRADPDNERIFVGTYEGFHYMDIPTGAWTERDEEGCIGRQVLSIAGSWAHPLRVITGRENAFFKGYVELSDDLGENGQTVYSSNGGRVVGIDFLPWGPPEDHYYACTLPDVVRGEFARSMDGGATWTLMPPTHHYAMTAVEADPVSGAIYLAGDQRVTRSYDEGQTWVPAWDGLPPGQVVRCLAAYPGGELVIEEHMFAGSDSGLYEAMLLYGEPWRSILAEGCRRVAMVPWFHEIGHWYRPAVVTTDGRVLVEQGGDWIDETGNLAGLQPIDLDYCWVGRMLYVVTANAGVFRAPFGGSGGAEGGGIVAAPPLAQPNPFRPVTRLSFTLDQPGPAGLEILDAAGRRVAVLLRGWCPAGRSEVPWRPGAAASGVYFARLSTPAGSSTLRLIRLR